MEFHSMIVDISILRIKRRVQKQHEDDCPGRKHGADKLPNILDSNGPEPGLERTSFDELMESIGRGGQRRTECWPNPIGTRPLGVLADTGLPERFTLWTTLYGQKELVLAILPRQFSLLCLSYALVPSTLCS